MSVLTKVSLKEILSQECAPERRFVPDLEDVVALVRQAKQTGHRVGIVGGVWDLPHIGHAKYLRLAKMECDLLVVVVDSDELVKSRKGPTRPVVPQEERIQMICHLSSPDIVILRDLDRHKADKEYLNKALNPDICVLSTSTGDIPESQRAVIAQYVECIKVFPPQAETSSSARIRLLAIDGATPLARAVTDLVDSKVHEAATILSSLPGEVQVIIETHMNTLKEV